MNPLKHILKNLCGPGRMEGALVITKDGMVIDAYLDESVNADTIAAFMSQVALTVRNGLKTLEHTSFTRYMMQSSQGRVYVEDLGSSLLVALSDMEMEPGKVNVALYQSANEIRKSGRIDI